jgi:hypothetical protein
MGENETFLIDSGETRDVIYAGIWPGCATRCIERFAERRGDLDVRLDSRP